MKELTPETLRPPFARYAHGVEIPAGWRIVQTSGQLGVNAGDSVPEDARAQADIAAIASAVNLYRLDNFRYPTTEQGLAALVSRPSLDPVPANWASGGYMDRLPVDPWGAAYQYLAPGVHGDFDVFSYGADAAPGGEGANADIGSWTATQ